MYLLKDAQCNENVSCFLVIYYYFNCLRCTLDCTAAETVSLCCQSSNFYYRHIENTLSLSHCLLGLPLSFFPPKKPIICTFRASLHEPGFRDLALFTSRSIVKFSICSYETAGWLGFFNRDLSKPAGKLANKDQKAG